MEQVREYIYQLEAHLADVQKQAARLIRKQDALAATLNDFGASMIALGAMLPPSPSNVNSAVVHLSSACCQVSSALATPCNGLQSAEYICLSKLARTERIMPTGPCSCVHMLPGVVASMLSIGGGNSCDNTLLTAPKSGWAGGTRRTSTVRRILLACAGKFESGSLAAGFMAMGGKTETLVRDAHDHAFVLTQNLDGPLKVAAPLNRHCVA